MQILIQSLSWSTSTLRRVNTGSVAVGHRKTQPGNRYCSPGWNSYTAATSKTLTEVPARHPFRRDLFCSDVVWQYTRQWYTVNNRYCQNKPWCFKRSSWSRGWIAAHPMASPGMTRNYKRKADEAEPAWTPRLGARGESSFCLSIL